MSSTFVPLYDRILVAEMDREQIAEGVHLPDSAKEEMKVGVVVAVGEGYIQEDGSVRPLRLKSEDRVLFGPYAGLSIRLSGVEFKVMREAEVIGTVKETSNE